MFIFSIEAFATARRSHAADRMPFRRSQAAAPVKEFGARTERREKMSRMRVRQLPAYCAVRLPVPFLSQSQIGQIALNSLVLCVDFCGHTNYITQPHAECVDAFAFSAVRRAVQRRCAASPMPAHDS